MTLHCIQGRSCPLRSNRAFNFAWPVVVTLVYPASEGRSNCGGCPSLAKRWATLIVPPSSIPAEPTVSVIIHWPTLPATTGVQGSSATVPRGVKSIDDPQINADERRFKKRFLNLRKSAKSAD